MSSRYRPLNACATLLTPCSDVAAIGPSSASRSRHRLVPPVDRGVWNHDDGRPQGEMGDLS